MGRCQDIQVLELTKIIDKFRLLSSLLIFPFVSITLSLYTVYADR
jgi:hypothetical protein